MKMYCTCGAVTEYSLHKPDKCPKCDKQFLKVAPMTCKPRPAPVPKHTAKPQTPRYQTPVDTQERNISFSEEEVPEGVEVVEEVVIPEIDKIQVVVSGVEFDPKKRIARGSGEKIGSIIGTTSVPIQRPPGVPDGTDIRKVLLNDCAPATRGKETEVNG